MTDLTVPQTTHPSALRAEVDRVWPDPGRAMPAASATLAAVAGIAGAVLLPAATAPGLGLVLVALLIAAAAVPAAWPRLGSHEVGFGALATLLIGVVAVRDAPWFVGLSLLGATGVASYALARGTSLVGALLGGLSLALAPLRGLPWAARGLRGHVHAARTSRTSWAPLLRTVGVSAGLLLVFGTLFASADAAFATLLPDVHLDTVPQRLFLFVAVAGAALAAAFLADQPPAWDVLAPAPARPVRPLEWIAPIALLDALFAAFVAVQLTVLFGGHSHVVHTAGLTYAEYARSGFGQLVVVTLLTLTVVAAAARWAPKETASQRSTLRVLLGALCLLALVVVASALYRLHLYEEAFGFTRLRLFMNAFESWLGVLVGLVLVAGVRLRARWLARAVVATAAAALLALAAVDPDGFVAARNVDRYTSSGRVDVAYLQGLSADAVPAIDRLPEPLRSCVLSGMTLPDPGDGLAGWNLARSRARSLLERRPALPVGACPSPAYGG